MRQYFSASLCGNGILGGGLVVDDEGVTYRTGKVTVPPEVRCLKMSFAEIQNVSEGRLLCFPTVSVTLDGGECYRFIVFGRKRFRELLESKIKQ